MSGTQIALAVLALGVFALCLRQGAAPARRAAREVGDGVLRILPIFAVALPMASFLSELIPEDIAAAWLGPESGFRGLVLAAIAGGFIPGGPFVTFPLVLTFAKAGAGVPQMVALISGWCIYGIHRVITWEYPLLGWRFSAIRLVAGLVMPVLIALAAEALLPLFPGALTLGRP
ncbi:MAG TPA: permease [Acetobacteraceae bacterium]|nr:permease [Acetobacteraceae bacterium]